MMTNLQDRGHLKKILHIFGRMAIGGAEGRTLDVMRNLDREKYRFHFCSLSGRSGPLDEEIRYLGGEVHLCRLDATFPWRFRKLLRTWRFDAVHSHVHYFSGYILKLAASERTPVRIAHFRSTHDGHADGIRRRLQRNVMRHLITKYATHILAVSESVLKIAWDENWESDPRCQVIYNGLDLSHFAGPPDREGVRKDFSLPEQSLLVIHVGRFGIMKNHVRLIDIFARLADMEPNARLLLVGGGDSGIANQVRRRVEELGIKKFVRFVGERNDIARLLKASDLMIFPSTREGLPGAVLEAAAAGIPVLASGLPGIREIAIHFPYVRCLSLDESDHEWLKAAKYLLYDEYVRGTEAEFTYLFEKSGFDIKECVEKLSNVWNGDPT
jgi:glycosyltransferase involved in cell wall biosynthesis